MTSQQSQIPQFLGQHKPMPRVQRNQIWSTFLFESSLFLTKSQNYIQNSLNYIFTATCTNPIREPHS